MKYVFGIGMVVFWSVVIVLSTAGLVSYEQRKTAGGNAVQGSSTVAALEDPQVRAAVVNGATTWSQELVTPHNTLKDCWMTIQGVVYNVTEYIPFHPGGTQTILDACGTDATEAFRTKGVVGKDHSANAYELLTRYKVAALGDPLPTVPGSGETTSATKGVQAPVSQPSTAPASASSETPVKQVPSTTATSPAVPQEAPVALTAAVVAAHNTTSDCWFIINNTVYDVTQYIPFHPGGTNTIKPWCGKEATNAFSTMGGRGRNHSRNAWSLLEKYAIGPLGSAAPQAAATASTGQAATSATLSNEETPYREAILAAYPGAQITALAIEDDGRAEFKFMLHGITYEGKMSAAYTITKLEDDD